MDVPKGDLVQVAMAAEDIETLDQICDLLEKGRSQIMVDALREYIYRNSIHFALENARRANQQIRAELMGEYTIIIPKELL